MQDFPLHLDFEIRYGCNLRCPMCVVSLSATERGELEHPQEHLNREQFRKLLEDGVRRGLRAVSLNGNNEPLLTPNLHEYVRAAKEAGVLDIMFHTNALLLTEDISAKLLDAGLTRIMFSLDAINKETYDRIRIGSDFGRVMCNINYFLELKRTRGLRLPLTRVSFVESKVNEDELAEFIADGRVPQQWRTTRRLPHHPAVFQLLCGAEGGGYCGEDLPDSTRSDCR